MEQIWQIYRDSNDCCNCTSRIHSFLLRQLANTTIYCSYCKAWLPTTMATSDPCSTNGGSLLFTFPHSWAMHATQEGHLRSTAWMKGYTTEWSIRVLYGSLVGPIFRFIISLFPSHSKKWLVIVMLLLVGRTPHSIPNPMQHLVPMLSIDMHDSKKVQVCLQFPAWKKSVSRPLCFLLYLHTAEPLSFLLGFPPP